MDFNEQLCWTCSKACGKCSWSENFTPVKGWDATKDEGSYQISSCPEYEYQGDCIKCSHFIKDFPTPRFYHIFCKHCKPNMCGCTNFIRGETV